MSTTVSIARGGVYISAATYAKYFNGVKAVALIVRDDHLHILPVMHMASGGALLKIRNAAGDRLVSSPDVFAEHGLYDWSADDVEATWSSTHAALTVPIPSPAQDAYQVFTLKNQQTSPATSVPSL